MLRIFGAIGLLGLVWAQAEPAKRPELGLVNWGRDFDQALAKAKKEGKPVFALFQEVPG